MTQIDLARAMDRSDSLIAGWERNEREPGLYDLIRLAGVLRADLDSLIRGDPGDTFAAGWNAALTCVDGRLPQVTSGLHGRRAVDDPEWRKRQ